MYGVNSMRRVLLTGAGGFIGRNIAEKLKSKCHLYCPSSKELDLLDEISVHNYLERYHFDVIIHSANRNNTRRSITSYDSLDGNLRMFFNLERCQKLYGKLIYFGSGAEYGREYYVPNMEEEYFGTHIPKDAYGFSKYIMAKTCEHSSQIYELCLFGVYGKYEEWERRFISNSICRALKGKDISIQQNVIFDYIWVDDLINIVDWFLENNPSCKRYNICRGQGIDLYSLAIMVRKILGINCRIVIANAGWKATYTGSNSRILKEMGFFKFTDYESSIQNLCNYYKANLDTIDEEKLI